ncbi:MAG: hypothetical protein ACO1O6_06465 [Bacteroidota bacterium]
MKWWSLFILVLVAGEALFAQEEEPTYYKVIVPQHSYSIDFALPVPIANRSFKGMMQGFARGSAQYRFGLKNGLYTGVGGNYTYFQLNRFKITPQMRGGMHIVNAYGILGFEKYSTERIGIDGGVRIGYSDITFHSDTLANPNKAAATLVEPYFAFCLTANHKTAYKWILSYTFLGLGFYPERVGDYANQDFKVSEYDRITRFLSFGFSYTHYFKQWD